MENLMPLDPDFTSLPPERAKAVEAWLSRPVGTCRFCGKPIYPTDPRARDPEEKDEDAATLLHLPCWEAVRALEEDDEPSN
jgi:hypothetical protein